MAFDILISRQLASIAIVPGDQVKPYRPLNLSHHRGTKSTERIFIQSGDADWIK